MRDREVTINVGGQDGEALEDDRPPSGNSGLAGPLYNTHRGICKTVGDQVEGGRLASVVARGVAQEHHRGL